MDGVVAGFHLGACSQGEVCSHDIGDVSPAMMESFFIVFVKAVFMVFYGFIGFCFPDPQGLFSSRANLIYYIYREKLRVESLGFRVVE